MSRAAARWGAVGVVIGVLAGFLIGWFVRPGVADGPYRPSAVDVGFSQDMILHHRQAVEMASVEVAFGSDEQVKELAMDMLKTQQDQIGRMSGWLLSWNRSLIAPAPYMTWMDHDMSAMPGMSTTHTEHGGQGAGASSGGGSNDAHAGHEGMAGMMPGMSGAPSAAPSTAPSTSAQPADARAMPGMATSAEMGRLRTSRGADADTQFLQLMLRHHRGGIPMAEYGAAHAGFVPLRDLAQSMVNTQNGEITLMQSMLASRHAPELSMN